MPAKGVMNGRLEVRGGKDGVSTVSADLEFNDISFSDSTGLHAGEKLQATLSLAANRTEQVWDSHISLDWQSGELFWQPLFLQGAHSLTAQILWDGLQLKLAQARLNMADVGEVSLDGVWDVAAKQLFVANVSGKKLGLKRLFSDYAKPYMGGGITADSEMSGTADASWKYSKGATQELTIGLHEASIVDGKKRFSLTFHYQP